MILIPSAIEVEFAAGGFGLVGVTDAADELGRLRPISEILPDVLARYGIAAELPESTLRRMAGDPS